jgi:hypothetical protein
MERKRGNWTFSKVKLPDNKDVRFGNIDDARMTWDATDGMRGPNPTSGFWSDLPSSAYGDPSASFQFFDHFTTVSYGDTAAPWTVDGGSGTFAAGAGGSMAEIALPATALSGSYINIKATQADIAYAPFSFTPGKKLWYETKLSLGSLSGQNFLFGLINPAEVMAARINRTTGLSGGVYFHQQGFNSGNTINFKAANNSGGVYEAIGVDTATSGGAYKKYGFKYDGSSTITPYINDVAGTAISLLSGVPTSGYGLTPTFSLQFCSNAVDSKSVLVDWVKVVQVG